MIEEQQKAPEQIDIFAPCPCCNGRTLDPRQDTAGVADDDLKDCPVCLGCGDMSITLVHRVERFAASSMPPGHRISQAVAAWIHADAAKILGQIPTAVVAEVRNE